MAYIMENSTHLGTHAPKDACASSAVYDETLKAAVKVISGALTNEESVLDGSHHVWLCGAHQAACLRDFEASAPLQLSAAIVLCICVDAVHYI